MKDKESLRNCHGLEETDKTRWWNAKWNLGSEGEKKDFGGDIGNIWIKSVVYSIVPVLTS